MIPAAGIVAGAGGVVLAFAMGGPPGALLGGIGVVAGVTGLHRALRSKSNPLGAVVALVVSGLAIAATAVALLAPVVAVPCDAVAIRESQFGKGFNGFDNSNVEEVLGKLLQVDFGAVRTGTDEPGVLMTLTNRKDVAMDFHVTVAAFDGAGNKIAEDGGDGFLAGTLLGPRAVEQQRVLARDVARLGGATFKVTAVQASPFSPTFCDSPPTS
ncbi:hypothetical protein [Mycolicibacterium sp. HK-90]|uniref:hypothetical protein n=1 Tax=Mycolicibacterium sp. HK-90 TaxID=3056937 RepID=UPI00265AF57A|nr:hypothetical protein [Mycolicibacterium sp. HK-90]WKG05566.1 hypothetical protein QU592_11010 [Mycolicibacterium sp. HK-90]